MTSIIILCIILAVIIWLTAFYFISFAKSLFTTKVPYVWSFSRQLEIIKELDLEKWKTIVDLGCGDGKALRFFEKEFWLNWTWYDINSFAILYWKLVNKLTKSQTKLYKQDFTKLKNLKDYNYIYIYLFPEFMEKIEDWIFKNKWKNTIIISNSFKFAKHKPFQVVKEKIYLYK